MIRAFGSNLAAFASPGAAFYIDEAATLDPVEFAAMDMEAFDRLGPIARAALATSRFGGSADAIWRRWGGPFADDEAVARNIRRQDEKFSGRFNCAAAAD